MVFRRSRRARPSHTPSHSPCTVVSELIALKQLIIERGEVQRRSEKAIKRTPGSVLGRGDSSVAQPATAAAATAAAAGGPELNRTVTGKPAAGCGKKKNCCRTEKRPHMTRRSVRRSSLRPAAPCARPAAAAAALVSTVLVMQLQERRRIGSR